MYFHCPFIKKPGAFHKFEGLQEVSRKTKKSEIMERGNSFQLFQIVFFVTRCHLITTN